MASPIVRQPPGYYLDSVQRYLGDALRTGRAATAGWRVRCCGPAVGWPWLAPGHDPGELLALLARAATLSEGDPASAARVLPAPAVGHCYHPDPSIAKGLLDRVERLAEQTADPDLLTDVLIGRLITFSGVSTLSAESLEWIDRLNALHHNSLVRTR